MQYVIVGSLLMVIIACAGWFILFFSKLSDSQTKLDYARAKVYLHLQKRAELIRGCELCAANNL
jgi:hypothetical protein